MKKLTKSIIDQIMRAIFTLLRLRTKQYPPKLRNKTRADFIEKIHKKNDGKD